MLRHSIASALVSSLVSCLVASSPRRLVAASLAGTAVAAPATPADDVAAGNAFNFSSYGALKGKPGNVFFSSTSLRQALGIAYLGARGETAKQLASAARLDADAGRAVAFARAETDGWTAARGDAALAIANRIWTGKTFVSSNGLGW